MIKTRMRNIFNFKYLFLFIYIYFFEMLMNSPEEQKKSNRYGQDFAILSRKLTICLFPSNDVFNALFEIVKQLYSLSRIC